MGKNSNSNDKYWRAGIALPIERKELFDARLAELGMKTLGDLTTFFCTAPGVVEALLPIYQKFSEARECAKGRTELRKELNDKIKGMTPEQLSMLLQIAGTAKEQE